MTSMVEAVKDEPEFMKKYGEDFIRAFHQEMEYMSMKAFIDDSIDLDGELKRIEKKYRFNEDMNILLNATGVHLQNAVKVKYWDLRRRAMASGEAELQAKASCKRVMEEIDRSTELYPEPISLQQDARFLLIDEMKGEKSLP